MSDFENGDVCIYDGIDYVFVSLMPEPHSSTAVLLDTDSGELALMETSSLFKPMSREVYELMKTKEAEDKGSKYRHKICDRHKPDVVIEVDVYDVLDAFGITNQAWGHGLKKFLCAGKRGHKDVEKDIKEGCHSMLEGLVLEVNKNDY